MKMTAERRAIDKIYKRRDQYEIPDWQREKVWNVQRKQLLIDSILNGWKLPKFYFIKTADDAFEVVDGQQRLNAIFEFCGNKLALSDEAAKKFGGLRYKDLAQPVVDRFDDFEIEYDLIENASEEEQKAFFLRVQGGMPTTASEKLNAEHSKLRDFCRKAAKHPFLAKSVAVPNTRLAHFDIVAKAATLEVEGLGAGLRFPDIQKVFRANASFSPSSAVAKRLTASLNLLQHAFKGGGESLRTRTIVQSLITLSCKLVDTGRTGQTGVAQNLRDFFGEFQKQLAVEIELGQRATDIDYVQFQQSVNANVKDGARTRHQILLRKLFRSSPELAALFDQSIYLEAGIPGRIAQHADSISELIGIANKKHSAATGEDLFKATSKTAQAIVALRKPIDSFDKYSKLIDELYFLFRESAKNRIGDPKAKWPVWPTSFADVNELRTQERHDVDHGEEKKVRSKRRKMGTVFVKYAGQGTPETIDPSRFALLQMNLLAAIEADLRQVVATI